MPNSAVWIMEIQKSIVLSNHSQKPRNHAGYEVFLMFFFRVFPYFFPLAVKKAPLALSTAGGKAERISDLPERVKACGEEKAAGLIGVGVPTLRDIVSELLKPGRDVRDERPKPILRTDVLEMPFFSQNAGISVFSMV